MKMGPPRPGPTTCNNFIALESPTSRKLTTLGVGAFRAIGNVADRTFRKFITSWD